MVCPVINYPEEKPEEKMSVEYPDKTSGPRPSSVTIRNMFSSVAQRYDLANRVMSLGRDLFWREALARRVKILESPGRLLDLATGTGDQIVAIKRARPDMAVTGLDLSPAMVELAGPKFARLAPPRPEMLVGDALDLPFDDDSFDSVSISFGLRNITARAELYGQVLRVLKPGGRFLALEMYYDRQTPASPLVGFYLKNIIPVLGGRIVSREKEAYKYLVSSIMGFPRPEELAGEMTRAGFVSTAFLTYTFHVVMLVWGEKPAAVPAAVRDDNL